jgi:hypothetical protein
MLTDEVDVTAVSCSDVDSWTRGRRGEDEAVARRRPCGSLDRTIADQKAVADRPWEWPDAEPAPLLGRLNVGDPTTVR